MLVFFMLATCCSGSSARLVNRSQMPFFDATDSIEIYMLEKHVYNQDDIDSNRTKFFAHVNDFVPLFHVAIGVKSLKTGQSTALEFIGKNNKSLYKPKSL